MDETTLTLNSPITEEQWDAMTDVDFRHTNEIIFITKHGKEVKFVKASAQPEIIYCKDCKYWREHKYAKETKKYIPFCGFNAIYTKSDDFCSRAERRES